MEITIAESNRDTGLLKELTVCLSPDVLAYAIKKPIVTVSVDSDQGHWTENET